MELPEQFSHNWNAISDVLEDREWLGRHGIVISFTHSASSRRSHPTEWSTLEDILREAVEFWKRMNESSSGQAPSEFASTHPSHETRIQNLEAELPKALAEYEAAKR